MSDVALHMRHQKQKVLFRAQAGNAPPAGIIADSTIVTGIIIDLITGISAAMDLSIATRHQTHGAVGSRQHQEHKVLFRAKPTPIANGTRSLRGAY